MRAYDPGKIGCYAGWRRYEKNPIIGEQIGEVSDPMVLPIKDRFHLYYSHRFLKKIRDEKRRVCADLLGVATGNRGKGAGDFAFCCCHCESLLFCAVFCVGGFVYP
mgnify:CR=1 FL=1